MLECCGSSNTGGNGGVDTSPVTGQAPPYSTTDATASSMASFLSSMDRQNGFILHNPPLAALHNMTQNKVPPSSSTSPLLTGGAAGASGQGFYMGKQPINFPMGSAAASAVTHSINEILSRPPQIGQFPRLTSMYLNNQAAAAAAAAAASRLSKPLAELPGRPPVYWPGAVQSNPWGARPPHPACPTTSDYQGGVSDRDSRDNKKKHTRPTFSGHQIFALEKTFEQTKYLAGPERARLAYALGMTESQVKVWFQNRRTKWRKRHAAEMATAKKKQEERAADHDGMDSGEDDGGSDSDNQFDFSSPIDNNNMKTMPPIDTSSLYPTMQ